MTPIERFMAKVEWGAKFNGTHCLLWTGATNNGYGLFWSPEQRLVKAHRWLYERWVGSIPDGLQLDHLCRVRNCVNPMHLEPVTPSTNVSRGDGPLLTKARHALILACPQGHIYNIENTYRYSDGRRACRTCQRERARLRKD